MDFIGSFAPSVGEDALDSLIQSLCLSWRENVSVAKLLEATNGILFDQSIINSMHKSNNYLFEQSVNASAFRKSQSCLFLKKILSPQIPGARCLPRKNKIPVQY